MVATTFWQSFFLWMLFIPLALVWGFALVDIFRRDDIPGWSKALWVVCVIVLPFFGTLIYLVARPSGATPEERAIYDDYAPYPVSNGVSELRTLADLHDRGKLTDSEFAAEKARLLGTESSVPA